MAKSSSNPQKSAYPVHKVVKTVCAICPAQCGLDAHVEDGKVVQVDGSVEHPWNMGWACAKARAYPDLVYHEDRLKYPMKKVNGKWERISWDEALDTIASKLKECKEKYGARALAVYFGDEIAMQGIFPRQILERFCHVYGSPNIFDPGSHCMSHKFAIWSMLFGGPVAHLADVQHSKCVITWGQNTVISNPLQALRIQLAKNSGAKLIVIDPRRTYFGKIADIYTPIRPGTDCALALAMLNVIITENLYDKEFVEKWTIGFDKLVERVRDYPPEKAAEITGVPVETIKNIARTFATTKPAHITQGYNTPDQCASGFYTNQCIYILQVITGNFGMAGSIYPVTRWLPFKNVLLPEMLKEKALGEAEFPTRPTFAPGTPVGQSMLLKDAILDGKPYPVKMLIVDGIDNIHEMPDTNRTIEAWKKVDFLVVMDIFMSETAKMADMVLPACTFLERSELGMSPVISTRPYIIWRKKAIEPLYESWPDAKIWLELGRRMYPEYFPWKEPEEAYDYCIEPAGLSVKYLTEEKPAGVWSEPNVIDYDEWKRKGFRTPSGKIELYSEKMKSLGVDPLPYYTEPTESPVGSPELAKEYPLMAITGVRLEVFYHAIFHNVHKMRQRHPEPFAELHPNTAKKYGISDGDMMIIESLNGSIEIRAKVTEDIIPQLVSIPHAWTDANANILTSEKPVDPVMGYPGLKTLLVRVKKKT